MICQLCLNPRKKVLQVHHLRGRKIPDANNQTNLRLLCRGCHRLVSLASFYRTIVRDQAAFSRFVELVKIRMEGP